MQCTNTTLDHLNVYDVHTGTIITPAWVLMNINVNAVWCILYSHICLDLKFHRV